MTLAENIASQAVRLNYLAQLMDDAEGARTGRDNGTALILKDISDALFSFASRPQGGSPITTSQSIANQAAKLNDLAQLMDDAEGARTGKDSGIGLILRDISDALFNLACLQKAA